MENQIYKLNLFTLSDTQLSPSYGHSSKVVESRPQSEITDTNVQLVKFPNNQTALEESIQEPSSPYSDYEEIKEDYHLSWDDTGPLRDNLNWQIQRETTSTNQQVTLDDIQSKEIATYLNCLSVDSIDLFDSKESTIKSVSTEESFKLPMYLSDPTVPEFHEFANTKFITTPFDDERRRKFGLSNNRELVINQATEDENEHIFQSLVISTPGIASPLSTRKGSPNVAIDLEELWGSQLPWLAFVTKSNYERYSFIRLNINPLDLFYVAVFKTAKRLIRILDNENSPRTYLVPTIQVGKLSVVCGLLLKHVRTCHEDYLSTGSISTLIYKNVKVAEKRAECSFSHCAFNSVKSEDSVNSFIQLISTISMAANLKPRFSTFSRDDFIFIRAEMDYYVDQQFRRIAKFKTTTVVPHHFVEDTSHLTT